MLPLLLLACRLLRLKPFSNRDHNRYEHRREIFWSANRGLERYAQARDPSATFRDGNHDDYRCFEHLASCPSGR